MDSDRVWALAGELRTSARARTEPNSRIFLRGEVFMVMNPNIQGIGALLSAFDWKSAGGNAREPVTCATDCIP